MITIEINEDCRNMADMKLLLEEVLNRVKRGSWLSYDPDYSITGTEEPEDEEGYQTTDKSEGGVN